MKDDTADISTATSAPDAGASPAPARKKARKKRAKSASKAGAKAANKTAATSAIEARLGHTFADPALLVTAMTHVSALKPSHKRGESYQRLEFLGDHVLGLIVSDMLYRSFPNADEGELSKRLADLVRKESCADVAKSLGLADDIKLGAVGAGASARLRKSVLGDICEAVIGAVFLDGGYTAAQQFVETNWTERMKKPRQPLRDAKTVLQEWAQGKGLELPQYIEVAREGPDHAPRFTAEVRIKGAKPARGEGASKRAAEQAAATALLAREGVRRDNDERPG